MEASYEVLLTGYAEEFLAENVRGARVLARVEDVLSLLADYPRLGPAYDSDYTAARPPFPCRRLPVSDTPFTLYYTVDDDAHAVTVFDVEWSGGDPTRRFHLL